MKISLPLIDCEPDTPPQLSANHLWREASYVGGRFVDAGCSRASLDDRQETGRYSRSLKKLGGQLGGIER
jgi:hypothetical protein